MEPRGLAPHAIALLMLVVVACSPSPDPPTRPDPGSGDAPRIIVVLSIDTLRADHLGVYGHERFTSPVIDALAAEGVLFLDASTTAPWTLPAHASMLTGLHPAAHGVRTQRTALPEGIPTLPRLLGEAGWQTAAVVNSTWLKRETFGLTRDFDAYEWVEDIKDKRTPTTWVTDRAIQWIRERGERPLFVFVHYYDVHSDYASLPEYEHLFVTPYEGDADGTAWQLQLANLEDEYVELCQTDFDLKKCNFGTTEKPLVVDASVEKVEFDSADIRHLEELYDAGIRQLDTEIGRFLRLLDELGVADETLLVLTADHGEEFHDHGRVEHFLTQYQEMLHVPLLVRGPGVPAGVRVASPVSLIDIAPTLLTLAGVDVPASMEGVDLAPLWKGADTDALDERLLFAEAPGGLNWEPVVPGIAPIFRSVRQGPYKLVRRDQDAVHLALYDLRRDPDEQRDVSADHPEIASRLAAVLQARIDAVTSAEPSAAPVEIDDEEADRLRALGYIVP